MRNPVGRVSIYTDYGFEEDYDGEPMDLEIKKVKSELKPLSTEEGSKLNTYINTSIEMYDSVLETTKALVVIDKRNRLNALQGLGDIAKGVMKIIPGEDNPVLKKLDTLQKNIEKLGEKTSEHFGEMKAFITEVKFFLKITTPTAVLMKCMVDCFRHPGQDAVDNFRDAYRRNSPIKLAYKFISFLEQKATNPLRMAMDAEQAVTTQTFQRWEDMFIRILNQFIMLETFATGLLGVESKHNIDVLHDRSLDVLKTIDDWKVEYQKDDHYWQKIEKFLTGYVWSHTSLNNEQKAKEIAAELAKYSTIDSFYVMVFNECNKNMDFSYVCPNEKEQLYFFYNVGHCCVFVYRSRKAYRMDEKEFKKTESDVKDMETNEKKTMNYYGTLTSIIDHQLLNTNYVRGDGLVMLIASRENVHVQVVNSPEHEKGPGYWGNIKMKVHVNKHNRNESDKVLIVGFP